ncbi:MAG: hypothetical protein KKD39_01345 [Candidatus Altiarchaeota archaeon]|nr:hypothetical protein [Candidatus Altiarchaeota archaeon]
MVSDDLVEAATLYVLASKRMDKHFARKAENIEKVMSVLSEEEVRNLGDYETAKKEIQTLLDLGLKQNVSEMAEKWRASRRLRS